LPLLCPLFGILKARVYTYQWAAMLILAYFIEGVMRAYADDGLAAVLAGLEIAAALIFIVAAAIFIRIASPRPARQPIKPGD
jgi:uncharacterized membrane protein